MSEVIVTSTGIALDNNKYFIEFNRIDNPIKLIWWIHHLCEKDWITKETIETLIEVTTKNMGIGMYEGEG